MIASAVNQAWRLLSAPAARRFKNALSDPGMVQRSKLLRLIERCQKTVFGRAHGFDRIRNVDSFRERIALQEWSDVAPYIDRIRTGEPAVLTSDPVVRLIPTGGSTGGLKLIPWTRGLATEFRAGISTWITDLQDRYPEIRRGPAYWSISPLGDESVHDGAIPVGFADDSDYLGGLLAPLVRCVFAAPSALRFIRDARAFRYASLRCLLATPELRLMSLWHPSFLSLLLDAALADRGRLISDIADGTISASVPEIARDAIQPWLAKQPRRAAELDRVDWNDVRSLWPRLQLVSCWGDGPAQLPCAALRRRLGDIPIQEKGLLATEGMVSLPWRGVRVAACTGHVIEFFGVDGKCRWMDEVEEGSIYEIVLTTAGGLWRYRLGDRVRIDGFLEKTPCLTFLGRARSACDLVGEKLEEGFVANCLAATIEGAEFAMMAPNADGTAGYTIFADAAVDDEILHRLDLALMANPQWKLARALNQLGPLRARRVDGSAKRVQMEHLRGTSLGAVKPVCLDPDREWENRFALAEPSCAR